MCAIAHLQFSSKRILPLFAYDGCVRGAYRILFNLTSGTRRNFYQPVLVRLSLDCAIMEAWLPFVTCRICILWIILSGWRFLFVIYANYGAMAVNASTTYMTIVELWWMARPLLPWNYDNHWKLNLHNSINGSRKKCQSLLLWEICFLSWHGD